MTEDITTQVLVQIGQDIANLERRLEDRFGRFEGEVARRFDRSDEQLRSIVALMGVLAKNDDRLDHRIEALEARLAGPGQG